MEKIIIKKVDQKFKVIETDNVWAEQKEILGEYRDKGHLGGNVYIFVTELSKEPVNLIMRMAEDSIDTINGPVLFAKLVEEVWVGLTDKEIQSILSSVVPIDPFNPFGVVEHFDIEKFHQEMGWLEVDNQ